MKKTNFLAILIFLAYMIGATAKAELSLDLPPVVAEKASSISVEANNVGAFTPKSVTAKKEISSTSNRNG